MEITKQDILYLVKKYTEVRYADRGFFFKKSEGEAVDPTSLPDAVDYFDEGHVQGFSIRNPNWNKTYLFLLGSNELVDWIYNFTFQFMRTPYKDTGTSDRIKVHTGFYRSYLRVREIIHEHIKEDKEILVYGHSLGGALATLAALDIQYNFPDKGVACVTSGSPRVGNRFFRNSYNRRVPNTLRFVFGADIVTKVPPRLFFYEHIGTLISINFRRGWSIRDHLMNRYIPAIIAKIQQGV